MSKIKKYQLLKLPSRSPVDWSRKWAFEKWEPNYKVKREIAKKIGNVNKKKIGR